MRCGPWQRLGSVLAQRPDRGLGPVLHADLAQNRFDMDLHGLFSDVIASRDVLVRVAPDDALQDVALPARKKAAWLRFETGHVESLTLRLDRSCRLVAVFELGCGRA